VKHLIIFILLNTACACSIVNDSKIWMFVVFVCSSSEHHSLEPCFLCQCGCVIKIMHIVGHTFAV